MNLSVNVRNIKLTEVKFGGRFSGEGGGEFIVKFSGEFIGEFGGGFARAHAQVIIYNI